MRQRGSEHQRHLHVGIAAKVVPRARGSPLDGEPPPRGEPERRKPSCGGPAYGAFPLVGTRLRSCPAKLEPGRTKPLNRWGAYGGIPPSNKPANLAGLEGEGANGAAPAALRDPATGCAEPLNRKRALLAPAPGPNPERAANSGSRKRRKARSHRRLERGAAFTRPPAHRAERGFKYQTRNHAEAHQSCAGPGRLGRKTRRAASSCCEDVDPSRGTARHASDITVRLGETRLPAASAATQT